MVIVQLLSWSQLQNWHVVPASDFDYFWTKSRVRLELGFYIMSLLSNILQMLSPEGESTFQGAPTVLKQNCFLSLRFPSPGPEQHWVLLAAGQELPAAHSSSIALDGPVPDPVRVLFSLCHPAKPEPSPPNAAEASQGRIMSLMAKKDRGIVNLCATLPWGCDQPNASNLGTNAQPCHSSSRHPRSKSWALTRHFPSLKTSEQN